MLEVQIFLSLFEIYSFRISDDPGARSLPVGMDLAGITTPERCMDAVILLDHLTIDQGLMIK